LFCFYLESSLGASWNWSSINNAAAAIDSPLERGHVVLFLLNAFWRGQTAGSYFLVFNAILNWDNLNAGRKGGREVTGQ